ncbi:MAG: MBL fold metallo-hydrolase [Anaerolineae bacterium]|jgi:glyoxylase-like metal-dependent hydrolase (beta-lactamase superfamily II)|nr:MBL fold metallo-hydrolase [Anaerolineae bacterium]
MPHVIHTLTLGLVETNCYLIADTDTGDCIMIDPVDEPQTLLDHIAQHGWTLRLVLATHGHFDHVLASKAVVEASGAPFYIHAADLFWIENLPERGLRWIGQPFPEAATPTRLLTDAPEVITVGSISLHTLFTPGHAPGHIAYHWPAQNLVFSGDALFKGSIGRTDLPGSDYETLMRSIFDKLLTLGDDTKVLPGHGGATTIGVERRTNPFLLSYE